jgi:hypothetical protein
MSPRISKRRHHILIWREVAKDGKHEQHGIKQTSCVDMPYISMEPPDSSGLRTV